MSKSSFKLTIKQIEAQRTIASHKYTLLTGGSRAGKTAINIDTIIIRAIKCKSRHLTMRRTFKDCKAAIWMETLPKWLELRYPQLKEGIDYEYNNTDHILTWHNGSEHWFGGMDNRKRLDKVLGKEYSTIHLSEASETEYEMFTRLESRLAEKNDLKKRIILDQNPGNRKHYLYKMFHLGLNPKDNTELAYKDQYAHLLMNPQDNLENLDEDYMRTLESLDRRSRERFLYGNYTDDNENALWRRPDIDRYRMVKYPDLTRVVVGVDPSGSSKGNEAGIITGGIGYIDGEKHYFVINDDSIKGSPNTWGSATVTAYTRVNADRVIGEDNYGGEMVENTIRNIDPMISYKSVRATRGKARRAEPIAALYERGLVHHVGSFEKLEDEMCEWTEDSDWSPNRLDALVWMLTELSGGNYVDTSLSLGQLGL